MPGRQQVHRLGEWLAAALPTLGSMPAASGLRLRRANLQTIRHLVSEDVTDLLKMFHHQKIVNDL